MRTDRIRAIVGKELRDLRRYPSALVPVVLVTVLALLVPLGMLSVPRFTGEPLSRDADLVRVSATTAVDASLSDEARVQLFLVEQFLLLFLLTPVTGAMAFAAHAIVGEKQGRTLEPLLATPVTTFELLVAKVLGALLPTLVITVAGVVIFFAGIAATAAPGVVAAMLSARTAVLLLFDGPAVALVALQAAILVSSRANDARTAQQFGVLIILPLAGVLVAQFSGTFSLTAAALAAIGIGLVVLWLLLVAVSIAAFDRETILTRWK
jgi:ABC-2 type transport system permease protein